MEKSFKTTLLLDLMGFDSSSRLVGALRFSAIPFCLSKRVFRLRISNSLLWLLRYYSEIDPTT